MPVAPASWSPDPSRPRLRRSHVLGELAAQVVDLGPDPAAAKLAKLGLNAVLAGTTELLAETIVLMESGGLPRQAFAHALASSVLASPFIGYKMDAALRRDYVATFSTRGLAKDVDLVLSEAGRGRLDLPLLGLTRELLDDALSRDLGDQDFLSLLARLQAANDLPPDIPVPSHEAVSSMPYVNLLDLDDLPPDARKVAESGQEQYGKLLNTWRALFHRPEIFETYLPFLRSVAGPGVVDQEVKDLSALLVAWLNGCRYTVSHRWSGALRNGADPDRLLDVVHGRWDAFPAPLRCSLELAREMTTQPPVVPAPDEPGLLSAALREAVSEHFTEAQIVELTMSLSMWNALSRFHRVMQFELDMPAPPEPARRPAASWKGPLMTGLTPSYGSMNVDWENRIDMVRLREQRLARLSAELEQSLPGRVAVLRLPQHPLHDRRRTSAPGRWTR